MIWNWCNSSNMLRNMSGATLETGADGNSFSDAVTKTNSYPLLIISLSVTFFFLLSYLISQTVPKRAKSAWKYKNIMCSLIHGVISGVWAIYW